MCHLVLLLYLISYIFFGLAVCMCLYTEVSHFLFVSYSRLHVGIKEPIDRLNLFLYDIYIIFQYLMFWAEKIRKPVLV